NAAVQVVPCASDLHVRLVDQPGGAHRLPVPPDLLGQGRAELLDPAQNGPSTDVDAAVGQDAGNALGRGAQLQVVADGQQDNVAREAMAGYQTRRLVRRMAATSTAGAHGATTLVVAVAGQV